MNANILGKRPEQSDRAEVPLGPLGVRDHACGLAHLYPHRVLRAEASHALRLLLLPGKAEDGRDKWEAEQDDQRLRLRPGDAADARAREFSRAAATHLMSGLSPDHRTTTSHRDLYNVHD